jgi:hypothetical protein
MGKQAAVEGISRRTALKRLGVGAGVAWAAPVISTWNQAAIAQTGTPRCTDCDGCLGPSCGQSPNGDPCFCASPGPGQPCECIQRECGPVCGQDPCPPGFICGFAECCNPDGPPRCVPLCGTVFDPNGDGGPGPDGVSLFSPFAQG